MATKSPGPKRTSRSRRTTAAQAEDSPEPTHRAATRKSTTQKPVERKTGVRKTTATEASKADTPEQDTSGTDIDTADGEAMTLEQLAEATGVAPRTIRYYQTKKLLQPPTKDGKDARLARYGTDHAERLRLIGELHDRGLKLPAIRDLLESGDASARVSDWLGLDESLRGSWDPDPARIFNRDELAELLTSTPPGTQGLLEDSKLVIRQGNSWLVPNPSLLDLTVDLIKDGVRPDLVIEAGSILQTNLRKASDQLIELFVKALGDGFGNGSDSAGLVDALRPVAGDAARMIFGQQLELSIEELLADTKRIRRR